MSIAISVILPIYNTERFLQRCLDSLLRQGMEDDGTWEVICVDDGSTDSCPAILANYVWRHPGVFRVVRLENGGVARARNVGIDRAQGEWLAFVDSDDYLVDGGLAYLLKHFCTKGVDVVGFKRVTLNPWQLSHWTYSDTPEGQVICKGSGHEIYNRYRQEWVTDKLYRRSFLQKYKIGFAKLYVAEDTEFNFRVFQRNPNVVLTDSNIYRYEQQNEYSLTQVRDEKRMERYLNAQLLIIAELNDYLVDTRTTMREGTLATLGARMHNFYTRSLMAKYSYKEWKERMTLINSCPYHTATMEGKWEWLGVIMNGISSSYLMYLFFSFLYCYVFRKFVHSRLA